MNRSEGASSSHENPPCAPRMSDADHIVGCVLTLFPSFHF
ncbi:hypothetical protein XCR1_980065 [Xenorhabdus cabanillasii JM26]|uniref:Uncharacterized protein n=1 Tax=Xenorhabdus cabanillasii JM26 TaxID=1427517 RepID=W1JCY5_9GAMM|nr:hypothetical protein XCR1_980065 [Xenorhabdus cabanillasii JM26]